MIVLRNTSFANVQFVEYSHGHSEITALLEFFRVIYSRMWKAGKKHDSHIQLGVTEMMLKGYFRFIKHETLLNEEIVLLDSINSKFDVKVEKKLTLITETKTSCRM